MKTILMLGLSLSLLAPLSAQAGAKEDFQKIYSEAKSTHDEAGNFKWTTTASRLSAARSAADDGKYEKAKELANQALQLAKESVAQRKNQAKVWQNAAIGG